MARRAGRVVAALAVVLAAAGGGYVAADAYDVVPGRLTLEPPPPTPAPFPSAPAAVEAPEAEVLLSHLDPDAPRPDPVEVTALATALAEDPRMGESVGVVVSDVLSGEVLADVDGSSPRIPASTTKVLTALAAISALGPDRTLTTRVTQPEPGRLVLVGGGDMLLSAGSGDPDVVNGRAGLGDLAEQTARSLRLAGIDEVRLGVDDSLFTGAALHPGWRPGYMLYVAPVSALAVDVARTRDEPYPPRHPDPAMHAARTFAELLGEHGVEVGEPRRTAAEPGALEIAAVESAPMREVVRYVSHTSDNTVAEVLGRLVALERGLPGSFAGATSAVVAEVGARAGIDTAGTTIADCSGLADGSTIPARVLTELIVHASSPGRAELLPVVVDLPVSGWQGTLADRLREGPAHGLVRAKTGSLPGVTALAGTLQTQGGRLLAFTVLADETPPGGQDRPRAAIDAFLQRLAVTSGG